LDLRVPCNNNYAAGSLRGRAKKDEEEEEEKEEKRRRRTAG